MPTLVAHRHPRRELYASSRSGKAAACQAQLGSTGPAVVARRHASLFAKYGPEGMRADASWMLEANFSRQDYDDYAFAVSIARCRRLDLRFTLYDPDQLSDPHSHYLKPFFEQLGQALLGNEHVTELHLHFWVGEFCPPEAMLSVIRNKKGLNLIGIDKDFLSRVGLMKFADAVIANPSIRTLCVHTTYRFGDDCSAWVARMLRTSPALRTLRLSRREAVSRKAMHEDWEAYAAEVGFHFRHLIDAKSLRQLDLGPADLCDAELADLAALCELNPSIVSVTGLHGRYPLGQRAQDCRDSARQRIDEALQRNRQRLAALGAAAFDLLLSGLPPESPLPAIPRDVCTALADNTPSDVIEQLAAGLDSGFSGPARQGAARY